MHEGVLPSRINRALTAKCTQLAVKCLLILVQLLTIHRQPSKRPGQFSAPLLLRQNLPGQTVRSPPKLPPWRQKRDKNLPNRVKKSPVGEKKLVRNRSHPTPGKYVLRLPIPTHSKRFPYSLPLISLHIPSKNKEIRILQPGVC